MPTSRLVLVLGPPRSGTTWVAGALGACRGVALVVEPDNEKTSLLARIGKRDVPRFPLPAQAAASSAYRALWRRSLESRLAPRLARGRLSRLLMGPAAASESRVAAKESRLQAQSGDFPAPDASAAISRPLGPRVIKSVHAVLCAGWLIDWLRPDAVVILSRHPLATLDSWRRLSMPDATRAWRVALRWLEVHGPASVPPSTDAPMVRMALQLGYMRYCLDTATSSAIRCGHEELCESPVGALRSVADQCGLEWTAKADHFLHRSDREGSGYRPARRAADEPGKWRGRYSAAELATVVPVLEAFRPETVRREARACRSEC